MRTVYALFVGIDTYPESPLRGCVNDAEAAEDWLLRQPGVRADVRRLHNARATRSAMVQGIGTHLGSAGPGDTALLWYSGHGSERRTDDPLASTGHAQALVCHDSLSEGGQPLLQDTELGAVLDEIARRGAHVVAVLDCCHSGGATRGPTARGVDWRPWWRTAGARSLRGTAPETASEHVLLAACRPHERAYEEVIGGESRGWYSHSLLHALDHLGPTATYGRAHALAEERVRVTTHPQRPELRGPSTQRFLHGEETGDSPFLLRHTIEGWEVNCGAAHGLRAPGAEFTLLDPGARERRVISVREVRPETSLAEPLGWQPVAEDVGTVHPVTPSALAFPPAAVTVTGQAGGVRLVEDAVAVSPLLATGGPGLPLSVETGGGWARVTGGAGHPVDPLPLRSPADAARVADCCAHIARWHQLRDITNPDTSLSSLVRITVEPLVGDLRYTAEDEIVCSYTPDGREPQVRVRIRNLWVDELWCVLLNLTDTYAASPHLYEGDFVGPGRAGTARHGEPVWLRLPPGRTVVRGASTRDVLKVIAAENELNTEPFRLPAWSPGTGARGASALREGRLVRLNGTGLRDMGGPARGSARWGTASVVIRTEVP
ncbi:caspase domain-containing protein [Streptomyces sp. t39]|uniref:caspase family protein n=1 Tax=Streptomyces sp. t39 TaxID=1828156 RepID=UPI0011CE86AD|nr:caspase family protein [Streptomyces sp. t39]TXS52604.1 caspase family protein [Streptomyces sp. t39]